MPLLALLLCLCALAGRAGGVELVGPAGGDAATVGNCSRSNPCLNFGNCELHTGGCACPPGYGGALCEKALLSACALTLSPAADRPTAMLCDRFPGGVGVISCDCLRQCMVHLPGGLTSHGVCFEHPGSVEAQTSDFPAADEVGVVYRRSSSPAVNDTMSREDYLLLQHTMQRRQVRDCGCALLQLPLTCACRAVQSAARVQLGGPMHAQHGRRQEAGVPLPHRLQGRRV